MLSTLLVPLIPILIAPPSHQFIEPESRLRVGGLDGRSAFQARRSADGGDVCAVYVLPSRQVVWEDRAATDAVLAIPLSFAGRSRFGFLAVSQGGGGRLYRTRVLLVSGRTVRSALDVAGELDGENALPDL